MATDTEWGTAGLLRAAGLLIESRQPAWQALLTHRMDPMHGASTYLVRFAYPGIVSVYEHNTGRLIVRSRPGQPTVPKVPRR